MTTIKTWQERATSELVADGWHAMEAEITDLRTALAAMEQLAQLNGEIAADLRTALAERDAEIETLRYEVDAIPAIKQERDTLRAAAQLAADWFAYFHDEGGTAFSTNVQDALTAALK